MTILTYPTPSGRHRATKPPLRLTQRGRIVRDLVCGAAVLTFAVFATPISVAFFTAVVWAGQMTGFAA